jgi:hypothetical protein
MGAQGSAQGGDSAHRFYISSPFLGLQKEREEAKQLIIRQNHAYGDSYGGSSDPLVETCQRDVCASDHYVLILGERYGTRRAEYGGKSVTELEFEAAVEAGLSIRAFVPIQRAGRPPRQSTADRLTLSGQGIGGGVS